MPADDRRHTARKNSGRQLPRQKSGNCRPNRAKKPAGRATAAKKYSCKTCEKGGADPITERSTPAKQTEKVAGRPKALAVTVGGAWAGGRKGRAGRKKYDYYQTGAGPHRRIFGKTAAASPNEDFPPGQKHTAARLPKQTCPQKSKNDARVAKTNAAAAAIKSTPERFT